MLKQTYVDLLTNHTADRVLVNELWTELDNKYSSKRRYYHTLEHLVSLLIELTAVKSEFQDWETVLFSLFYHDVVYNALKSDNEEKSAELAEKRMRQISVSNEKIALCKLQILATKSHLQSVNNDTNLFTDADLSVLGKPWEVYKQYCENVRREYAMFPNFVYNPGRKKVIKHFLTMDRIFKTDFFYEKFEIQAKKNLQKEMELL